MTLVPKRSKRGVAGFTIKTLCPGAPIPLRWHVLHASNPSNPCSNAPVPCPLCSEAVFRYSLLAHYEALHQGDIPPEYATVTDEERQRVARVTAIRVRQFAAPTGQRRCADGSGSAANSRKQRKGDSGVAADAAAIAGPTAATVAAAAAAAGNDVAVEADNVEPVDDDNGSTGSSSDSEE